jgi:DNA-binding response OmpR family regulator
MASEVLVVEDEADIRRLICLCLERDGFRCRTAASGTEAQRELAAATPDLVILDLMLPELDGLELCRRIRGDARTAAVPIIILTARTDEVDRVVGLEVGADDYVGKPFSPKELMARVRAVLRRSGQRETPRVLRAGDITLDPLRHQVQVADQPVVLTPKEFDLLQALLDATGRVLSREYLLNRIWGYARADEIESRTVDVHVRRLRVKLGAAGRRIETLKGVGYRLEGE